jgi:hypothetical protein
VEVALAPAAATAAEAATAGSLTPTRAANAARVASPRHDLLQR